MNSVKQFSVLSLMVISCWVVAATPGDVMTELGIETDKLKQDVLLNLKEPR